MPWEKWGRTVAYNYYRGSGGRAERIEDTAPPPAPRPNPTSQREKGREETGFAQMLSRLMPSKLGELLPNKLGELETEDLILLLILYLMYRDSGDSELLMIMGAMFLL